MKSLLVLIVLFLTVFSQPTELNLPVRPDTQEKLSFSLQRLADELEYFRTPFQNKTNLYKRVAQVEQYLQDVTSQVSDFENIIRGRANMIAGKNNVIVGSYNTLRGSNNYVFIEKYTGQANGDLLIGRWRIEIQKKTLILINSGFAISFINEEANRKYLRYLTDNRKFSMGTSSGESMVTVVKEDADQASGFSFGSTGQGSAGQNGNNNGLTVVRNLPQQSAVSARSSLASSQASTPQSQLVAPAATVVSIKQTIISQTPQASQQQTNPVTRPSSSIPSSPSLTNTQPTSSEQSPLSRRVGIQQAISSRSLSFGSTTNQPNTSQQQNVQPRQVTNIISSNRLQFGSTTTSNLRTEPQVQTQIQAQSDNLSQNNPSTQFFAQQQDQRIALGSRPSRPLSQNNSAFSTGSTQQRISTISSQQPTQPAPIINLATWRNRS